MWLRPLLAAAGTAAQLRHWLHCSCSAAQMRRSLWNFDLIAVWRKRCSCFQKTLEACEHNPATQKINASSHVSLLSVSPGSEWEGGASITPDDDVFVHLAKTYSHNHGSMHQGNGCADTGLFQDGITNGYQWYSLAGQRGAVKLLWQRAESVPLRVHLHMLRLWCPSTSSVMCCPLLDISSTTQTFSLSVSQTRTNVSVWFLETMGQNPVRRTKQKCDQDCSPLICLLWYPAAETQSIQSALASVQRGLTQSELCHVTE